MGMLGRERRGISWGVASVSMDLWVGTGGIRDSILR